MVRLLRSLTYQQAKLDQCFNPTMVRLLQKAIQAWEKTEAKFQSHNGAIAASDADEIPIGTLIQFQSHNGAIAAF